MQVSKPFSAYVLGIMLMLSWLGPLCGETVLASDRKALIIGNGAYAEMPLQNATNDARGVAADLQSLGFEVSLQTDLPLPDLKHAVQAFSASVQPGDVALFFYSGHGVQYQGENFLIPIDANISTGADLPYEGLHVSRVLAHLGETGSQLNIVTLDACRDNPYGETFRGAGVTRGLARMHGSSGTLLAYATAPGKVAADGYREHSPYTEQLRRFLRQPGLPLIQLFNEVSLAVMAATHHQQEPWTSSSGLPRFCFSGCEASVSSQPPPSPEPVPGAVFHDRLANGQQGPAMVAIPGGSFWTISPENRRISLSLAAFAMAQTETTVQEFRRFVEDTGYLTEAEASGGCYTANADFTGGEQHPELNWRDPSFPQQDDHPVLCVSWNDALAYADWLSQSTGMSYRLPSEAEWEYAARAGTETGQFWGNDPDAGCQFANAADQNFKQQFSTWPYRIMDCQDGAVFTAPAGRYRQNAFGLFDMLGNAYEWVADCYSDSIQAPLESGSDRATTDGSHCTQRVARGGAWSNGPRDIQSGYRNRVYQGGPYFNRGFRLARDLDG